MAPIPRSPAQSGEMHAASSLRGTGVADRLAGGGGFGDPLAVPIAWAALAVTRRESFTAPTTFVAAAAVGTGEPATSTRPIHSPSLRL
jgi:hypothetical protein